MIVGIDLPILLEALAMAASRHESMARAQKHGRKHDLKAEAMRKLRFELSTGRKHLAQGGAS